MSKRVLNTYALMQGIEKYVVSGAVAGLTGVAWHDDQNLAFTDGSTIHLPRPNAMWNDDELLLWRYKAEHELGHEDAVNSSPHWKEVMVDNRKKPEYKDDGMLWWLSNVISDHVQEHNRIGDMIGRDEVLLHGRQHFLHKIVFADVKEKLPTVHKGGSKAAKGEENIDMENAIGTGIFLWDTEQRMKWNPHITMPSTENKAANDVWKMVKDKSGVDLTVIKNEQQVFDAAVKIRKLFPEVPKNNNFMNAKPMAGEGESEGGEGAKGAKSGAQCTAEGEVKKGEQKSAKAISFMPTGYHSGETPKFKYDYSKGTGVYAPRHPVPLNKGKRKMGYDYSGAGGHHQRAVEALVRKTNLPAKVRAFLMAMKREKYTTGWRSGRLDTNRLADVLRGKEDLFRRKEPVRLVDSAVYLLVDSSGSMSGHSFQSACASAIMMGEALQGIGCNIEIAGFTEFSGGPEGCIHDIWCGFGQRFAKPFIYEKMEKMATSLSNNADGENILYAYSRLKAQKEQKKILIVLSDGSPAAEGPHGSTIDIGQFTANVIKQIEKDKSVHLVGLGMSGYSPSRFYKNAAMVERGKALEPTLLEIVKNAILN